MSGVTFDGWETHICADCLELDRDSLAHFRTKGSKNGVRRYQNPDGTWTPLGLRERRVREGFGEGREERRQAKKAAKAAERSARAERMAKFKAERAEEKRKRNPKNMTDAELKRGIDRLKMEQEYRELNRNPLLKTAESLAKSYMDSKARKEEAQNRRIDQYTKRLNAQAQLAKARAELRRENNARLEDITGIGRTKARAEKYKARSDFLKAKTERSKNTIRGALSSTTGSLIRKQGNNIVKAWGDEAIGVKAGRAVKKGISKGRAMFNNLRNHYLYGRSGTASGHGPSLT